MADGQRVIGLSLAACILDIVKGLVNEEAVEKIITSTNAFSEEEFGRVLEYYSKSYWEECPKLAKEIAWRLWNKGLINQPKTRSEQHLNIADGWWLVNGIQTSDLSSLKQEAS